MTSPNAKQQEAITAPIATLAIIAGPGTGKTKTLVDRINFLAKNNAKSDDILALTFTKKAAEEMNSRLKNTGVTDAKITTFHGLCFEILKEQEAGLHILSETERLSIIKQIARPAAFKKFTARELALIISRVKNLADDSKGAKELAKNYQTKMQELCKNDFDDLLLKTYELLKANSDLKNDIKQRYRHILVDEFQDTNLLQYKILQQICTDSIFVIGDPLQSIYGFRGADSSIFDVFAKDYPETKTVSLVVNYRSGKSIIKLANNIYPNLPNLLANSCDEGQVQAVEVLNEFSEASWVINKIQRAIGGSNLINAASDSAQAQCSLRDFAVLYRSRHAARALQSAFANSDIPVRIIGDGCPYDDPKIQTVISLLAKISNPERQIIINNMNELQTNSLCKGFSTNDSPSLLSEKIINTFGFEINDNLRQLQSTLYQFSSAKEATNYFDQIAAQGFYDKQAEAVTLMTIHAAKGLEFPHIFIIGAENGILPGENSQLDEEKRLFYVAATRAKQSLEIFYTQKRGGKPSKMSDFLKDIPSTVLPRSTDKNLATDKIRAQKRQAKKAQTTLF